MKELKFRAWAGGVMVYFGLFNIMANEYGIARQEPPHLSVSKDNKTIMQYTGLKDKNGKEIYESDLISFREHLKYKKRSKGESYKIVNSVVCFKDGMFLLNPPNAEWNNMYLSILHSQLEVVGNIYENSELLNKKE